MTTPEGKIKQQVKRVLAKYPVYAFMPVQSGYGASGLDFHCFVSVDTVPIAFFIETKAPGKALTPRQQELWLKLRKLNAMVFVIDGEKELVRLEAWLQGLLHTWDESDEHPRSPNAA